MIVSIATVVLPVLRSPMMSSRWPRPIGVIASMTLMPVCSGSVTGWRPTMPGAWTSRRRRRRVLDRALAVDRLAERVDDPAEQGVADRHRQDPARSTGRPGPRRGPRRSPRTTAPIESSSRLSARPTAPVLELEELVDRRVRKAGDVGDAVADLGDAPDLLGRDAGRVVARRGARAPRRSPRRRWSALPSLAPSICVVVLAACVPRGQSHGLNPTARHQVLPKGIKATAGGGIYLQVADLADQRAAEQRLVDHDLELDRCPANGQGL